MFLSRELKSFISVAEAKSIKTAAERLNLSSPAVSSMLKKLESRLKVKLFKYKNGTMEMSQDAIMLYKDLSSHYYELKDIERKVTSNSNSINIYLEKDLYFLGNLINCYFMSLGMRAKIDSLSESSNYMDLSICKFINNEEVDNNNFIDIKFSIIKKARQDIKIMVLNPKFGEVDLFQELQKEVMKEFKIEKIIFIEDFHYMIEMVTTGYALTVAPNATHFLKLINQSFFELELKELNFKQKININIGKIKNAQMKLIISEFIINLKDRCEHK
ncbi:TPA: LysR family transcriptional regulator [Yersinia enterocolitica]